MDEILEEREEELKKFISYVDEIPDSRRQWQVGYSLAEIFLVVLCAQICGFESLREYEEYGKIKLKFLRNFLPYKDGPPSKSTISRVLALICPEKLESIFILAMQQVLSPQEPQVIAIDGKTNRGFMTEGEEKLHLVSAYATNSGLVLGQEKVEDKSNEITAIPELLEILFLENQIVSIDAMGCQKNIAKKIREKKANYILALKGNQGNLHDNVSLYFEGPEHLKACHFFEHNDKGHGRVETRRCYATEAIEWLEERHKWTDLKTIFMIESIRYIKGKESLERRHFIASLPPNPKSLLAGVRAHWGIENNLHWILDVIFHEDQRIIWNQNIAQNESIIRKMALNLIKQYQIIRKADTGKAKVAIKTLRKLLLADDYGMAMLLKGEL